MNAELFHTQLRNGSTPVPRSCVSGLEGKGMEEEWRRGRSPHASSLSDRAKCASMHDRCAVSLRGVSCR